MNLMTDSERKWALEAESKPEIEGKPERRWALEAESKPEIEGKHLHHKDMFK